MGSHEVAEFLAVRPDDRLDGVVGALQSEGHTVETVADVESAVDAAKHQETFDGVLVLDAPAEEGYRDVDGIVQLRELDTLVGLPVIVYVDDGGQDAVIRAFEEGAADVCQVPARRSEVLSQKLSYAVGVGGEFDDEDARLRSLFDAYPEDLFIKDTHNRLANHTGVADHLEHLDAEWYTNLTDYELFPEAFAEFLYEEEQALLEEETAVEDKIEHYRTPTGQDRWVATTKAPRYDDEGEIVGIVGASLDVTDVKRQERQLAALSEASRALTRAETKDDIAQSVVDIATEIRPLPRVQIAYANGQEGLCPAVSGADRDSIYPTATPPFETHRAWYRVAAAEGRSILVVPPGTEVPDSQAVTVERDSSVPVPGLFIPLSEHGVVGFVTDGGPLDSFPVELADVLAANARAAVERVERQQELAETTDRFREFTLLGSHELRNRLQTAFGQLARLKSGADPEAVEGLEATIESVDRLVSQLVTLGQTGSVAAATEAVSLEAATRDAWDRIGAEEATLSCSTLPAAVEANRGSLTELLDHLLENAVEHAGPDVTVTVGWLRDDDGFFVADDGPGIDPVLAERAFDIDWDAAARRSGYGLYIVSTIADAHNWTVDIDRDASGARVEIRDVQRLQ